MTGMHQNNETHNRIFILVSSTIQNMWCEWVTESCFLLTKIQFPSMITSKVLCTNIHTQTTEPMLYLLVQVVASYGSIRTLETPTVALSPYSKRKNIGETFFSKNTWLFHTFVWSCMYVVLRSSWENMKTTVEMIIVKKTFKVSVFVSFSCTLTLLS